MYEKLKESGWSGKLRGFIMSEDFASILRYLYADSQGGKRFTPVVKNFFRAFEECPYRELKIVIVGQDPYPQPNVADGIAFSCSQTPKIQPSLRYILGEVERTVYPEGGYSHDKDLKRWSNQGILMLNTALTCQINEIGSHVELWKPFITYLFDMLNTYNPGTIYVFLGKNAKAFHTLISGDNYKLFASHPAAAAYNKEKAWDSGDIFNNVNKIMHKMYGEKIIW